MPEACLTYFSIQDGHNPHLELTLGGQKRISSVLKHLEKKWGSSMVATGELMLFPYYTKENLSNCKSWTLDDSEITVAVIYTAVGSPATFRLRYKSGHFLFCVWFAMWKVGSLYNFVFFPLFQGMVGSLHMNLNFLLSFLHHFPLRLVYSPKLHREVALRVLRVYLMNGKRLRYQVRSTNPLIRLMQQMQLRLKIWIMYQFVR